MNMLGDLRTSSQNTSQVLGQSWKSCWGRCWAACRIVPPWPTTTSCWPFSRPLLCVLFPHKSKQIRTLVTQFWNATFANTPVLIYPEDLKPVLSQVKQKTPIILPGFQAVDVPDDYSGQYSSESSQLETNISGVKIASVGKRDSLLSRAGELRERSSDTPSKPVSVKLDFGSPKPPRRELLEEEASVDFVFIPPETKERVLTEHQKEVKRTKRVDIPAMYNNLDASLDTTVFTQYTQSQEDLVEKLPADGEVAETIKDEDKVKVQEVEMEIEEAPEPQMKPAQEDMDISSEVDPAGKGASKQEKPAEELAPKSADLLTTKDNGPGEDVAKETSETSSDDCNISASSDVVSGTPQKNSRRQSFITLEKYEEGKPASPIRVTKFTGPLAKPSSSQESAHSQQKDTSSQVSSEAKADLKTMHEPGHSRNHSEQQETSQRAAKELVEGGKMEQPHPDEEESEKRRSRGSDYEDDIIPDTQTQVDAAEFIQQEPGQTKGAVEDASPTMDKDDSANSKDDSSLDDDFVDDSQVSSSQSEIRRSGRRRSRPLRPGEEREEVEERHAKQRRRSSLKEDSQVSLPDSQTDSQSQGRPSRRSKVLAEAPEVEVKDRLRRTRSDSQTSSPSPAVQNDSQSLGRVTRRSKAPGTTEEDINQNKSTPISQNDSQSQGRPSRRSKMSGSTDEMNRSDSQMLSSTHGSQTDSQTQGRSGRRGKSAGLTDEEMSRSDSQSGLSASLNDSQSHGRPSRRSKAATPLEEMSQTDSQPTLSTPVSQTDSHSQGRSSRRSKVAASVEEMGQPDLRTSMSSPVSQIDSQPQGRSGRRSKGTASAEEMSQTDSQPALSISISQTDSQSEGRISRRSKVAATAEESSQTDSQTSLPTLVSQTDSQSQGRPGRRNKVTAPVEEMSQTYSQPALLTSASQAVSQSQDRLETSSKMIAELNVGPCPAPTAQTECSQVAGDSEGAQESSQGLGRYKTRGSSQGLLSGTETPESDSSEIHGDSLVSQKRRRRSKLLKSEVASQSSQTNEVPEDSQRTKTMETSPEVEMENSEVHQNLEPVIITEAETVEPLQNMETNNLPELISPQSVEKTSLEAKMEVVQTITEAHENVPSEKVEGETTKPIEEPSTELKKVDSQVVHRCPHIKRGRGRRRSRGCNCRAATMSKENDFQSQENDILSQDALSQEDDTLSQEGGITESQGLEDPVESRVSADPSEPHSSSESTHHQPEEVLPSSSSSLMLKQMMMCSWKGIH
ncbi:hypothetical protein AGOR_G00218300 [Albula goreensis]|uniref:Uncharacterized protein n=1 Tax=Albula goreensis TaxID=1534307 RepID=A0A8T3CMZ3_9TELE|nr:hypothetical protein AGOR_G00218300 [Albula goreensis]